MVWCALPDARSTSTPKLFILTRVASSRWFATWNPSMKERSPSERTGNGDRVRRAGLRRLLRLIDAHRDGEHAPLLVLGERSGHLADLEVAVRAPAPTVEHEEDRTAREQGGERDVLAVEARGVRVGHALAGGDARAWGEGSELVGRRRRRLLRCGRAVRRRRRHARGRRAARRRGAVARREGRSERQRQCDAGPGHDARPRRAARIAAGSSRWV